MRVSRERRFRHAIIRAAVALLAWFDDAVSADGFLAATKTPESTYLRVVRLRAARRPPLGDEHHVVRLRRHDGGGRRVAPVARRRVTLAVVFESELVADFVRDNRRRRGRRVLAANDGNGAGARPVAAHRLARRRVESALARSEASIWI